jgi:hypothetical protein
MVHAPLCDWRWVDRAQHNFVGGGAADCDEKAFDHPYTVSGNHSDR